MSLNMTVSETAASTDDMKGARIASWGKLNQYRLRYVKKYAGHSILDAGCSTGSYVSQLHGEGYNVVGIDLLAEQEWQHFSPQLNTVATVKTLPYGDEAFDSVISFEVLEHVPDPQVALAEFHRVCKKNIIVSVPNCELPDEMLRSGMVYAHWRDRTHCNFFTKESLRETLEAANFGVQILTLINPIRPDVMVWRSLGVPLKIAQGLGRISRRIPARKEYKMTLLAVATKRN